MLYAASWADISVALINLLPKCCNLLLTETLPWLISVNGWIYLYSYLYNYNRRKHLEGNEYPCLLYASLKYFYCKHLATYQKICDEEILGALLS